MRILRALYHGVPMLAVICLGGLVGVAADLTDWAWLCRSEQTLRAWFLELERRANG